MMTAKPENERVSITVRIPEHILKQIDASLVKKDVPISRNHWIVEALVEKLKKVTGEGGEDGAQ